MANFIRAFLRRHLSESTRAALIRRFGFLARGRTIRDWLRERSGGWSEQRESLIRRTDDVLAIVDRRLHKVEATFIEKSAWFEDLLNTKDKERWSQVEAFNERSDSLLVLLDQRMCRIEARLHKIETSLCDGLPSAERVDMVTLPELPGEGDAGTLHRRPMAQVPIPEANAVSQLQPNSATMVSDPTPRLRKRAHDVS